MLALIGSRDLLRALGAHTVRALVALEPGGLVGRARHNAASAAALASVRRREADDVERWIAARPAHVLPADAVGRPHRAGA